MAKKQAPQPTERVKMTKNEAVETLLVTLFSIMKDNKRKYEENLAKLNENYFYYFSWVGIDALEQDIIYHLVKKVYDSINDFENIASGLAPDKYTWAYRVVYGTIKENKEYCSKAYNVRSSSTSELSNIKSTVEFTKRLDLIETFDKNLRWYVRETDLAQEELLALIEIKDKIDSPDYKPGIWKDILG